MNVVDADCVNVPVCDVDTVLDTVELDDCVTVTVEEVVGVDERDVDNDDVKDVETVVDTELLPECVNDTDSVGEIDVDEVDEIVPVMLSAPDSADEGDADGELDALSEPEAQLEVD